jgi:hypothetical protein
VQSKPFLLTIVETVQAKVTAMVKARLRRMVTVWPEAQ